MRPFEELQFLLFHCGLYFHATMQQQELTSISHTSETQKAFEEAAGGKNNTAQLVSGIYLGTDQNPEITDAP